VTYGKPKFDLTGQTFGRLTVAFLSKERAPRKRRSELLWDCICSCGNTKLVTSQHLRKSLVRSCGCLQAESKKETNRTHGASKTSEYNIWCGIKARCDNKDDPDYGGRGITYANEWKEFEPFLSYVGLRPSSIHTLDRINNNGNYEPGNVHWATPKEQSANTRRKRIEDFSTEDLWKELHRRGAIESEFNQ
jgi:hypothetical protein